MTQQVEIIEELESNPDSPFKLYGIRFVGENMSEFEKFCDTYSVDTKVTISTNFHHIIAYIENIVKRGRALERDFRQEGTMKDRLCALPTEYGKLRLFCLRISEHVLILGNGGIKTTRTYQESPILKEYAEVLQRVDKHIRMQEKSGIVDYSKVIVTV